MSHSLCKIKEEKDASAVLLLIVLIISFFMDVCMRMMLCTLAFLHWVNYEVTPLVANVECWTDCWCWLLLFQSDMVQSVSVILHVLMIACMCIAVRQMTAAVYQWLTGQRSSLEAGKHPSTWLCLTSRTPPLVCSLAGLNVSNDSLSVYIFGLQYAELIILDWTLFLLDSIQIVENLGQFKPPCIFLYGSKLCLRRYNPAVGHRFAV